jgi:hypothetical protein
LKIGSLVQFDSFVNAFDDTNTRFELAPGTSALLLDYDDYDITFLVHGEVLYTSAISEESIISPLAAANW